VTATVGAACQGGEVLVETVQLPYRAPLDLDALLRFLGARAVDGVESYRDGVYARSLALPHGPAVVELSAGPGDSVRCALWLADGRDREAAVGRCRRLLDLDTDPAVVSAALAADPVLGPLVGKAPGLRVPGHVDGLEMAVRAVLGQQVSVQAARLLAGRLTARYGTDLPLPHPTVTRLFPTAAALRDAELGMPASRLRALRAVAVAVDGGLALHPAVDRAETERRLLALAGIGPWTVSYLAMRVLADPDAFLPWDVGVRHALTRLGLPADPAAAARLAESWRPWRSYALLHLWHSLDRKDV
jgi:AraC family transcriptional regulator of adaptative response / DNA-3-methyladenine glycosylase II